MGQTLARDLTAPSTGVNVVGGVNDQISVLGNLTVNATAGVTAPVVRVNFLGSSSSLAVGQDYPLFTYNPANTINLSGLANVQVAASIRGQLSLINDTTNNSLDVQIQLHHVRRGVPHLDRHARQRLGHQYNSELEEWRKPRDLFRWGQRRL